MNDIERLKAKVREEMVLYADRSVSEAEVIVSAMKENNLTTYVDVGCWAGTLAKDVLKRHETCNAILIDGCGIFLDILRDNLTEEESKRTAIIECAIVPTEYSGETIFRIPYESTGSSSIVNSNKKYLEQFEYKPTQVLTLAYLLAILRLDENIFLKLDIEGLDIDIIQNMFSRGFKPKGLHFEVHDENDYQRLLVNYLNKMKPSMFGATIYKYPLFLSKGHQFYSVSLNEKSYSVLGMNPDRVYTVRSQ